MCLAEQALAKGAADLAPKVWPKSLKGLLQEDEAPQLQAEVKVAPDLHCYICRGGRSRWCSCRRFGGTLLVVPPG